MQRIEGKKKKTNYGKNLKQAQAPVKDDNRVNEKKTRKTQLGLG